jgi:glycosyltransferase involved in cell wall biosynthesis
MRIAYDVSGLLPPLTGVGNYIQQLLLHLLDADHDHTYHLLSHRLPVHLHLNGHTQAVWTPPQFPNRLLWLQGLLPAALRRLRPTIAHFPNFVAPAFSSIPAIITVHDVSLLRWPHFYAPRQRLLMRPFIRPSAQRAQVIIAVSLQSKQELVQALHVSPDKVHVIHEAAAPIFHERLVASRRASQLASYGWDATARHLLYVGTIEPRKNVARLLRALVLLHRRGLRAHLWLVGQAGWQAESILQWVRELGLTSFVHRTGYVPLATLRAFYQACDAFVFPSLHEGFGLPVIEAMASGAIVALSELPALREVAGAAGQYFNPYEVESITEAVWRVSQDQALRDNLRDQARARAAQFSWARAARETLAVYQQVAQASARPMKELYWPDDQPVVTTGHEKFEQVELEGK